MLRIGKERLPNEAGGLILPDGQVWEVPNRAADHGADPTQDFCYLAEDLLTLVQDWVNAHPGEYTIDPIVWHTHPAGLIGPSSVDLAQRIPGMKFVVVTMPDGPAVRF